MSPSAEQAVDMLVPVLVIDIDMRRIDIAVSSILSDVRLHVNDALSNMYPVRICLITGAPDVLVRQKPGFPKL